MDQTEGLGLGLLLWLGLAMPEYAPSENLGLSDRVYTDLQSIRPTVYGTFGLLGFGLSGCNRGNHVVIDGGCINSWSMLGFYHSTLGFYYSG